MGKKEEKYYLVNADILPEAILKTIEAKELLAAGLANTVHEAVERVGLSRSAFYKYKDGIFPFNTMMKERIVTVSLDLEHRSGILSKVLSSIAHIEGNVLTINQTIPLQGMANVVLSVDTAHMQGDVTSLLNMLRQAEGVRKAAIIGQGAS
jgi:chorismate mutase